MSPGPEPVRSRSAARAADAVTDWQLDERAHAGAEHLDPAYVERYERKSQFDPAPDLELLRAHGLGRESILVDLGAGTGVFAFAAARVCRRVVAVDVSDAMTTAMRNRVAELVIDNVHVVDAGFLTYQHEGAPPDFVFTRNALHQVPDFWKGVALSRIAALLRPGAILRLRDLVYDFDPADADARIADWFAGAVDDPAVGYTADDLAAHVRDEHSTYTWLLEPMLVRTGFEIVDRDVRRGAYAAYTCRRR
jgi:SAM-dependent methyltransferase